MWTIETQLFKMVGDSLTQGEPPVPPLRELFSVEQTERPTFIVGNGLSLGAVYENRILNPANGHSQIGWSEVVENAFEESYKTKPPSGANSLILAEAILQKIHSKEKLLKAIQDGVMELTPSALHRSLLRLQPHALITTNYDFLLEDVCESQEIAWQCFVRDAWKHPATENDALSIFKMHGTLPSGQRQQAQHGGYHYPPGPMRNSPQSSVVISEQDYDVCNGELELAGHTKGTFWQSLLRPIVILGKGVYWEDLSFMRMLRFRKAMLSEGKMSAAAYWILNKITPAERLTLNNLGITPLVLNMPRKLEDATRYFALVHFFGWVTQEAIIFDNEALVNEHQRLLRKPKVVAIGLSAHNTAGRVKFSYQGVDDFQLPSAGRRNMEFDKAEEFAGGSALTAISTYAALNEPTIDHGAALVSVVGQDIFSREIFEHCKKWNIDADAIAVKDGQQTWRSTILVHNFRSSRDNDASSLQRNIYPGQRVFLDRPFPDGQLGEPELQQFVQMLKDNDQLRVIYLDKWLADDPKLSAEVIGPVDDRAKPGFLAMEENLALLREATKCLPGVDVIYETGGSGSSEARVEKRLGECINILTAGFPFFARRIVQSIDRCHDKEFPALHHFLHCEDHRSLDFEDERNAILDVLVILNINLRQPMGQWRPINTAAWVSNAKLYVGRENTYRWFIVTLHDLGAIAFDLDQNIFCYFPTHVDQEDVKNTSGAGDTFRGAFSFALANLLVDSLEVAERLRRCTEFAVYCASERCKEFSIADVLASFRDDEKYRKRLSGESQQV